MRNSGAIEDFGTIRMPDESIEPILPSSVRNELTAWLTEIWAGDELKGVGVPIRKKAILVGPPGTGKTTLAHHLSARLGLPLLEVGTENLIDCFLGSSSRNIGALFDILAQSPPIVVMMDEFDSLASKRIAARNGADGEKNGWVNTLLRRIDAYDGFMLAATNMAEEIDRAIWRRFDIHIELGLPGRTEIMKILSRYLSPYVLGDASLAKLADAFETASPAIIQQWCHAIKRNIVIGERLGWQMERESVVSRIVASIKPPPGIGLPRLWSLGAQDPSIAVLPRMISDWSTVDHEDPVVENVVNISARGAR